jgi:3-oxoacyl-[acyl-carrier-protein] synthase III
MTSILGFGRYLPEGRITNEMLEAEFGTEPNWVLGACGIRERRKAADGEGVSELAHRAAEDCLQRCGLAASDLGAIVVGTGTPPRQFPGVSADLQRALGAPGIPAFDIHLASAGGLFALATAVDLCPRYGPVLVVGAERMTEVLAREPRAKETAILFGDGAGACVVAPGEGALEVVDVRLHSDATFADAIRMDFGGAFEMEGRTVILQANRKLQAAVADIASRNGVALSDVGLFLFHQANLNLLKQVGRALKIPEERVFVNLDRYGNTSSASLLIAASEAWDLGLLAPGATAVMAAFGAGLSWGAALLRRKA